MTEEMPGGERGNVDYSRRDEWARVQAERAQGNRAEIGDSWIRTPGDAFSGALEERRDVLVRARHIITRMFVNPALKNVTSTAADTFRDAVESLEAEDLLMELNL